MQAVNGTWTLSQPNEAAAKQRNQPDGSDTLHDIESQCFAGIRGSGQEELTASHGVTKRPV